MSKLTSKEERFCQAYTVNGGNASNAYRDAYNTQNMKNKTINEKACRLFKESKIRARIDELQKPITEQYAITRELITEKVMKVIRGAERPTATDDVRNPELLLRSAMELSKLHGLNVEKNPLSLGVHIHNETIIDTGSSVLKDLIKNAARLLEPQK